MQERGTIRAYFRITTAATAGGTLVGASTGMYAGFEGAIAGGVVGLFVGLLAGVGMASTKIWRDAMNRELDRHLLGGYRPSIPQESAARDGSPQGSKGPEG